MMENRTLFECFGLKDKHLYETDMQFQLEIEQTNYTRQSWFNFPKKNNNNRIHTSHTTNLINLFILFQLKYLNICNIMPSLTSTLNKL